MKNLKLKLFLRIIITFLISILINEINGLKCAANRPKINPGILNSTQNNARRRLDNEKEETEEAEEKPISIGLDYTDFEEQSSKIDLDDLIKDKIKESINFTVIEFQKILNIKSHENISLGEIKGSEQIIKKRCGVNFNNKTYSTFLIENDVIIFPTLDDSLEEDILAEGEFCLITNNYRVVGGVLKINPNITFNKNDSDKYFKYVLLHEFTHILIFNPSLMEKLEMIEEEEDSKQLIVKSSKVLEKAKQHFNCEHMNGVKLEKEGDENIDGYHWDARYMLGDYMISIDYIDVVISDITLALFEDSGFYKVNYYTGGLFKFGKNKGCDFLHKKCNLTDSIFLDDFCNHPDYSKCSQSKISKGRCTIFNYALDNITIDSDYQYFEDPSIGGIKQIDFCPVTDNFENQSSNYYYSQSCNNDNLNSNSNSNQFKQKYGKNSFCFIIEINKANNTNTSENNSISNNSENITITNDSTIPNNSLLRNLEELDLEAVCYQVECKKETKELFIRIGGNLTINCINGGKQAIKLDDIEGVINCPNFYDICDFSNNNSCNEIFDCIDNGVEANKSSFIYEPKEYSKFHIFNFYLFIFLLIILY